MEEVPIVFATNDEFAKLTSVAIESIKSNMSKNKLYSIYVFYTRLTKENINKLEASHSENLHIKCIDITSYINFDDLYEINQYTYEIYFRYYAPQILNYDKIIYLDSDIIVVNDIATLLNEKIGNSPIAVVTDYTYYIDNSKTNFNSGVIVINSREFEKQKIRERCIEIIKKNKYKFPDQDALNEICRKSAFILKPKYNYQVSMTYNHIFKMKIKKKKYRELFSEKPIVIHFSYITKPFKNIYSKYNDDFWKYAKSTPFYKELQDEYIENSYEILLNSPIKDIYIDMAEEGKIGIYGILEGFIYQLRYWFLYKICRRKQNEDKKYTKKNSTSNLQKNR